MLSDCDFIVNFVLWCLRSEVAGRAAIRGIFNRAGILHMVNIEDAVSTIRTCRKLINSDEDEAFHLALPWFVDRVHDSTDS